MKIKTLLGLLFVTLCIHTQEFKAADNAGAFLETPASASAAGLGLAYTAVAEDSHAVLWNPGALGFIQKTDIAVMSTQAFETTTLTGHLALPVWGWGLGLGYVSAQTGDIARATYSSDSGEGLLTGDTLSYRSSALFLAAGKSLTQTISLGISLKILAEQIEAAHANGIGVDAGVLFRPIQPLRFGLSVQNLMAPKMEWTTPSKNLETYPLNWRAGVAYSFWDTITLSADINSRANRTSSVYLGAQYQPTPFLALRTGLSDGILSLGTGLKIAPFTMNFAYSKPKFDYLSDVYKLSFGMVF
ncbi:MAG: PorV/PorQ family protein [Candidatus Margulisiibacteriota bacterium]